MTNNEYVRRRNLLIPEAEKYANKIIKTNGKDDKDWTNEFILKMDRLAVVDKLQEGFLHKANQIHVEQ